MSKARRTCLFGSIAGGLFGGVVFYLMAFTQTVDLEIAALLLLASFTFLCAAVNWEVTNALVDAKKRQDQA